MDIESLNKSMTGGGAGVVVCVLDDGIKTIPFFRGRAYEVNYSTKVGTKLCGSHGTAVSSVVMNHCPEALIYSYNIRDTNDTVAAINAALADILARAKADKRRYVVNCSFAGDGDKSNGLIAEMERRMDALVAANVPVIVAAGNDGEDVLTGKYPSCFYSPITVSALNNDGTFARFSAWHNEVDFAEVGADVEIRNLDGSSGRGDGTSFAAPIVAAKCAALLSRYPTMTEPELYETLKANAQDLLEQGRDSRTGWGWIAALDKGKEEPKEEPKEDKPVEDMRRTLRLKSPYMKGDDVKECQTKLSGYSPGTIDGVFGKKTDAAVRAFQKAKGLVVDGIVGAKTWAALDKPGTKYDVDAIESLMRLTVGDPYIIGAQGHELTKEYLDKRKAAAPAYFTNGRYEWLVEQIKLAQRLNRKLYCEDCSGLLMACNDVLGFWPDKDLTAEGIRKKCRETSRSEVRPGDIAFYVTNGEATHMAWLGKDGLYEAVGTAYGVVLRADIDDRRTLNRMTAKVDTRPSWTEWGRP